MVYSCVYDRSGKFITAQLSGCDWGKIAVDDNFIIREESLSNTELNGKFNDNIDHALLLNKTPEVNL